MSLYISLELIWSEVKRFVAKNNYKSFESKDYLALITKGFDNIGVNSWKNYCNRVIKLEQEHRLIDAQVDLNIEDVVAEYQSSESDTDSENHF